MPEVTTQLSQDQIDFFNREGYLAIDALTTSEEVAWLRESYDRIFAERAGRDEGDQFDLAGADEEGKEAALPQILNPSKYAPELNDSQLLANARTVAKQLLGPEASISFAHAIFKPAHHGAPTPWHQDHAYEPPNKITHNVGFWIPLQQATVENGCMQFVPGSHKVKPHVYRHRSIGDDPRVHALELHHDEMDKVHDIVACPLPPGGATLHGDYTLHYTAPNRSDIPRRALIIQASTAPETLNNPPRFPWQEEKRTARMERAEATKAASS